MQHTSHNRHVIKNLQWGKGRFGGLEVDPSALKQFVLFGKNNLILSLF